MEEKLKNLENEIFQDRATMIDHSIWLFILTVSLNSLDHNSLLTFIAFILAPVIYFYYFNLISEKGTFPSRYQNLINQINSNQYNNMSTECLMAKIELSRCKTNKLSFSKFSIFILPILFYTASFFYYLHNIFNVSTILK